MSQETENQVPTDLEYFVVCGLGSLGQHCVSSLTEFGVKIVAIEQQLPASWDIEFLRDLLEELIIGDCRHNDILHRAKINNCRAALIVTTDDRVNVETAIAIRQLNPRTRLVMRSAKENLNYLLSQQLGNFIAFDPTELSTSAFTLAALGTEVLGFFDLDRQIWQVYRRSITADDSWRGRSIISLEDNQRRILAHYQDSQNMSDLTFGDWNTNDSIRVGDTLVYLKIAKNLDTRLSYANFATQQLRTTDNWFDILGVRFRQALSPFTQLNFRQQIRKVALISTIIILSLLITGTLVFSWYYPKITTFSAFFATAILLLGGYGDLFAELDDISFIPWWIRLFSLILTVLGTVFVGVLYALLTETLLSSQFEFVKQRASIPQQDHVVIVGMGTTGQKVRALLSNFKQPMVGITFNSNFYQQYAVEIPLITGNLKSCLAKANLIHAKSAVIVTDDEILNLEAALMIKAIASDLNIVLKTSGIRISHHLGKLLPEAQIVGIYAVAAAAFAGAAFGENILSLFRLADKTVLVTEYMVEAGDTLHGLLLADIAYGYGVVPIIYQQPNRTSVSLPLDGFLLKIGDRLVVLSTIDGLRRIEQGRLNLAAKKWHIEVMQALTSDALFEGANAIVRVTGCNLALARKTMNNLPQTLLLPLYQHQAERLIKELRKVLIVSRLLSSE